MAASGSRAAWAWHRVLKAQLRSWERSFDSPALQPWRPCCRAFSEASGGGTGDLERGGGGRPDSAPAWPASAQRRERPDSASASTGGPARGNENVAASNSKGASGDRLPAANSQGPVDFGARLANVTEDDLDNLIAFRNFKGIRGLPPLDSILGQDDEQEKKAQRREAERRKQEEIKKARVKQVDALGRAYATGKRKTSIARVWIAEGGGNITINGKSHDLYFLDLDHRVQLLEPFVVTNTLGSFDVRSTVKGGGVSGQSGALRHGISKALQLFDPALRPLLKSEGMLTRDDRIVERKKPGKAKARKSFQWVKR